MYKLFLMNCFLIALLIGCSSQSFENSSAANIEDEYQKLLGLIAEENFEDANIILEKLNKSFEDSDILKVYVNAKIESQKSGESDYSQIINNLKIGIPDTYDGEFKNEIEIFKNEVLKFQKITEEKWIEEVTELVKRVNVYGVTSPYSLTEDELEEALKKLSKIQQVEHGKDMYHFLNSIFYHKLFVKDQNWSIIITSYEELLKVDLKVDNPIYDEILYVFEVYDGKEGIKKELNSAREYKNFEDNLPLPPTIGMSENELRDSSWGQPQKINKTEVEDGIFEQWVYSLDRYVYLENGIVTGIQQNK